jgi:3-hydroxyisobutyrate dehydrogenase/2-hydroxy-3-oxopropionate reductase
MAEALVLAKSRGLDLARVVEVVSSLTGASWMFEIRAPHMIEGDYTPRSAVNIWLKYLGLVGDIAEAFVLDIPLANAARERFVAASEAGLGAEDDAAVIKPYAKRAGIALPGSD